MRTGTLPTTPGYVDGMIAGVAAVPDVCLLIDSPGCTVEKVEKLAVMHDLGSDLLQRSGVHRVVCTNLLDTDFVFGTEESVRRTFRLIQEHGRPAMVLLGQSSIPLFMGTDGVAIAASIERESGIPVAAVPCDVVSGDFLGGFARVVEALARQIPLPPADKHTDAVALVGYFHTRHEADHGANVAELRRIFEALSLPVLSVWLSGESVAELARAAEAEYLVGLPHGGEAASILAERVGSTRVEMGLPIGLAGSVEWVRQLGERFQRRSQAEAFVQRELAQIVPRLEWPVAQRFAGRRAVVVADPFTAPGLVAYLAELGIRVSFVALHTRDQSAGRAVEEKLRALGCSPRVTIDPSVPELELECAELKRHDEVDFVIASGNERDCAKTLELPMLELGFPCYGRHALLDAPWLGFRGALWLADAIYNHLAEWEYRHY